MGWMYVEQTMATMAGVIGISNAVSPVQRSWSRAPPESRVSTSDGVLASRHRPAAAPPRLGGRPLSTLKSFATPHMTIC